MKIKKKKLPNKLSKKKTREVFGKLFKIQLLLSFIFVFCYLTLGFLLGAGSITRDIGEKIRVAGATITTVVKVFDVPDPPALIAVSGCNSQNLPYISLSWNEEDDATHFDLSRDGQDLMLGILENQYTDEAVLASIEYSYAVLAVGPMGTALSNTVFVTAQNCAPSITPIVRITTFQSRNVSNYSGKPSTTNRRPSFAGSTNIANAEIEIQVVGGKIVYGSTLANSNGFWQWKVPANLSYGNHTIFASSTDPSDPSLNATTFLAFKIEEEKQDEDEEAPQTESELPSQVAPSPSPAPDTQTAVPQEAPVEEEKPFDFQVELEGKTLIRGVTIGEEAFRGETLNVKLIFDQEIQMYSTAQVNFALFNDEGFVHEFHQSIDPSKILSFENNIPLDRKWKTGKYKLQISVEVENVIVSHEGYFLLKDRPAVSIGSSALTLTQVLENLGWLVAFSLLLLLIFLALAFWERHLANQALFQITERFLKKKGYIN